MLFRIMTPLLVFTVVACLSQAKADSGLTVTFNIPEEMPKNTSIGSLIDQLALTTKLNETIENLEFNFLGSTSVTSLFRIEVRTSKLFTKLKIDRENENVCRYKTECVFDFNVAARGTTSNYYEIINVIINITDINDNAPFFEQSFIQSNISESTTANQTILSTDGASDLDRGRNNSVISHELLPKTGDFRLEMQSSHFASTLKIITNRDLDRERQDSYELHVIARDGGNPTRTGTLTIRVNVLDENDNTPKFIRDYANITVKETLPNNTVIFKFTARDNDAGLNGNVVYRFKSFLTNGAEISKLFSINNVTGEVSIRGKLEYTPNTVYSMIVEASDQGNNPRSATARLDVRVQDVGNNPPKVTLNFFEEVTNNVVKILEDAPLGQVIAHITVEDTDSLNNGEVTCRTYSTYFGLQSFGNKGYTVMIQHKLDRETTDKHDVTVTCSDKGTPVLDDTVTFTVKVMDTNDNAPKFSEYYYNVNIYENNKIGIPIIKVSASDPDEGPNSDITYSMEPPSDTRFTIDRKTGQVTANIIFDREQTAHLTFQVRARDHGSPSKNNTATVVITVNDTNDNSPTFTKQHTLLTISENLKPGERVGNEILQAVDEDLDENRKIVYSLPKSFNASSIPFIVLSTGEIKTNQILDREKMSRYDFPVIATDRGTPSRTGSANITVLVQDQNDNVPVFIFPNSVNNTVSIPNTTPVETIIVSIQAYDVDDDSQGNGNGKVMYFIKDGNSDGVFYLNHETGSLFYRKAVVFKDRISREFKLTLSARDNGSPVLESTQTLTVIVQYTNLTTATVSQHESSDNKYVLIVVSVICATFVCSVGLIAVIIVLRKKGGDDKIKHPGLTYPVSRISSPPPLYDAAGPMSHINKGFQVSSDKQLRNKVSFSLENKGQTFTKEQMMEKLTGSKNGRLTSTSTDSLEGKHNGLHRAPLQPLVHNNKYIDQAPTKLSPEESPSETSGETIVTDSGHGGSEEDFSHQNNDHKIELDPFNYKKDIFVIHENRNNGIKIPAKVQGDPSVYASLRQGQGESSEYASLRQDRPSSKSKYLDDSLLTSSINSMWSDPNNMVCRQSSSVAPSHTLPTIPAWSGLHSDSRFGMNDIFYKDGTLGSQSAHSRDDDDCTTTSGSYTINPDDLDVDLRPRDLFV